MKGVLPWLIRWTRHAGTKDFCPALAAVVTIVPVQNIIFLTVHFFTLLVPISQLGRQACWVVCLCVSECTSTACNYFVWTVLQILYSALFLFIRLFSLCLFLTISSSFYSDFFLAFSVPALRNPICLAVMLSSNPSSCLSLQQSAR
jgi:hypothetical protein